MRLVQTSVASPEQYEVLQGQRQVGYIRLRHGQMRVDCPSVGGETVLEARPDGDGSFREYERELYLNKAKEAIRAWLEQEP